MQERPPHSPNPPPRAQPQVTLQAAVCSYLFHYLRQKCMMISFLFILYSFVMSCMASFVFYLLWICKLYSPLKRIPPRQDTLLEVYGHWLSLYTSGVLIDYLLPINSATLAVGCCELRLRSTPRYRLVCICFPPPGRGLPYGSGLGLSRCLGPGECLHSFIHIVSSHIYSDRIT